MATLTLDDIDHLSADERLALIGRLWDSLTDTDLPLPDAQRVELENRLASFELERQRGVTWEDLKAELTARAP
jgi:putative addiction module component (TIGR02574 family)